MLSLAAQADDNVYLDRPYRDLQHPQKLGFSVELDALHVDSKSDVLALAAKQTPVKSQLSRGSCSIFSAIGLLESMLIIEGLERRSVDLSEEWLQYIISLNATEEGATSPENFKALKKYGTASEKKLPYIGETWEEAQTTLTQERCGHLKSTTLEKCLIGHRDPSLIDLSEDEIMKSDPEFAKAKNDSERRREKYFESTRAWGKTLSRETEIKSLLAQGTPLTLDIDFFYGSWNHRRAEELSMDRSLKNWKKGIVGYPEDSSVDRKISTKKPAGHSVVIIGYDDTIEVTYSLNMRDGSKQKFKRKGVYIFKNSWGTDSFGVDFEYEGQSLPGYGMITQDYAHEYGQFFRLKL